MAASDAEKVAAEVNKMKRAGSDVTAYDPVVKQYADVADFSHQEQLWLTSLGMTSFSVCLGKASGSPGVVVYNDDSDESLFNRRIDVDGDVYWSAKLSKIGLGSTQGNSKNGIQLGGDGITAILDTGTSLIAAPQEALSKVVDAMDKYSRLSEGCQNLTGLPDLEFTFGGQDFRLPPEAYMGEMDPGNLSDFSFDDVMPHLRHYKEQQYAMRMSASGKPMANSERKDTMCVPLLMSMGQEQMWIFGMPFFRMYYTMFRLNKDSSDGKEMLFAEAGNDCQLGTTSELRLPEQQHMPIKIDATKLLIPRHLRSRRGPGSLLRR